MEKFMLPCINKMLFGIDCPGCGLQRSVVLLFQGHFQDAFEMYPAIYTLLLLLCYLIFSRVRKIRHHFNIKVGLICVNALVVTVHYSFKMHYLVESI